jgi:hypothetical protein
MEFRLMQSRHPECIGAAVAVAASVAALPKRYASIIDVNVILRRGTGHMPGNQRYDTRPAWSI